MIRLALTRTHRRMQELMTVVTGLRPKAAGRVGLWLLAGGLAGLIPVAARAGTWYTAEFDGSQCVPPTSSHATGHADLYLSSDESRLRIQIRIWNLEGHMTACHVHQGAPGQYGGQLFTIPVFQDTTWADWMITDYGRTNLKVGLLFINIHTEEIPNGEIRGQIYPAPSLSFTSALGGSEVVPPTGSSATGFADLTLWANGRRLHVDLTANGLSGPALSSHLHRAARGSNGPVIWDLGIPSNRVVIDLTPTNAQIQDLLNELVYADVETQAWPSGEIRGQIGGYTSAGVPGSPADPSVPGGPSPDSPDGARIAPEAAALGLLVTPNPTRGPVTVGFRMPQPGAAALEIFDAAGRFIRRIDAGELPAGAAALLWDGRSASGRKVAPGSYLTRLTVRGAGRVSRVESRGLIVLE
jgi:hypothetical protein